MREKIVAGNWKMNTTIAETKSLLEGLKENFPQNTEVRVIVSPPFTNLQQAIESTKGTKIEVAAQNMHQNEKGAFTGEISASMLKALEVQTVILGHSERRAIFKEDDALLAKKVNTALQNDLSPIFCVGEELAERKANKHFEVVENQLKNALFQLDAAAWKNIVIAYEPVWAIGTGETASPEQAQEIHAYIRKTIAEKYGAALADTVSILYGGSVKPANAAEIFSQPDVDGGLIGGAALKVEDFTAIINAR